jgi:multiple sugar transport system permease protein
MTATATIQPAGGRSSVRRRRRWPTTIVAVVIVFVLLFPLYWIVNVSLMNQIDILRYPPPFIPPQVSFDGYQAAFARAGEYITSSLIYAIGTVIVTMLIATPAAYALSRLRSRVTIGFLFLLLLAQMIPGIVMANSLYALFVGLRWISTYQAVILADATIAIPFAIIVMRAFMLGIPRELIEAAVVDGASQWRVFLSVVVPLSRNALVAAALFAFLFGWGDFLFAVTLNADAHKVPLTVGIYRFVGAYSVEWPSVMATAVIAAVPAALLLVIAQRYVAAGVTAGAVKE